MPHDPIGPGELRTAAVKAKLWGVLPAPEGWHSVRFWSELLISARSPPVGPGWSAPFVAELRHHTDEVYQLWCVEMRYKASITTPADLQRVLTSAAWFDTHNVALHT
jgi:hypothetical protein